jgi:TM2 domain-containing membrane protein YozV
MSFAGNVLQNVDGIQYFYIAGIFIFIALFIVIVYRTIKIPRKDLDDFKTSIFDQEELNSNQKTDIS